MRKISSSAEEISPISLMEASGQIPAPQEQQQQQQPQSAEKEGEEEEKRSDERVKKEASPKGTEAGPSRV